MADDETKSPSNWELYRGIERVEIAVQSLTQGSVSSQVFAIEKAALNGRIDGLNERVVELTAQDLVNKRAIADANKAEEEQRNRNRLFVYGIIAAPIVGVIVSFIASGGLTV